MCNTGISGAAIVLVLFILLIIILGAYISGGVKMACQNTNNCNNTKHNSSNYIIIVVLYILLAIILGAWIW